MALRECPDCKRQVSDLAAACINCGYPLARDLPELPGLVEEPAPRRQPVDRERVDLTRVRPESLPGVQTTEQTSKYWKSRLVLSYCVAGIGLIVAVAFIPREGGSGGQAKSVEPCAVIGFGICFIGLIMAVWAKLGAWWDHK